MLSAQTLNRVSHSYRRGYYAGYEGQPAQNDAVPTTDNGVPLKPFSDFDYDEGYRAGANDKRWTDHYAARGIA
jgi:hypothetical protein